MQVLVGGNGMQTSLVKTGRPTGIEDWSTGLKGARLLTPVPDGCDISSWFCAAFLREHICIYNIRELKRKSTGSLKPHYLCLTCPPFAVPPAPPIQCQPIYMSPPSPLLIYKGDTSGMSPLLKDFSLVCWILFSPLLLIVMTEDYQGLWSVTFVV